MINLRVEHEQRKVQNTYSKKKERLKWFIHVHIITVILCIGRPCLFKLKQVICSAILLLRWLVNSGLLYFYESNNVTDFTCFTVLDSEA